MSELKLWKNPMTTPSKADVLKVAGEPVAWLWETAAETGIQRARPHPNLGVAVVPLYTEAQLLAMYAKGAEDMRERADDLADLVSKAMRKAWHLGQLYWQQADSDFQSQWKKSDETQAKFGELVDSTVDAIRALPITPTNEGENNG